MGFFKKRSFESEILSVVNLKSVYVRQHRRHYEANAAASTASMRKQEVGVSKGCV